MKKETMKKLIAVLLVLSMISMLCACNKSFELQMQDAEGNPSVAGLVIEQVINILTQLLLCLISALAAWAAEKLGSNLKLKNLNIAVQTVCEITRQTVGELQQTTVEKMKYLNGGKLRPEDIAELRASLLHIVKMKLDEATKELVLASGADLDSLIKGECEAYLAQMKTYFPYPAQIPDPTDVPAPRTED